MKRCFLHDRGLVTFSLYLNIPKTNTITKKQRVEEARRLLAKMKTHIVSYYQEQYPDLFASPRTFRLESFNRKLNENNFFSRPPWVFNYWIIYKPLLSEKKLFFLLHPGPRSRWANSSNPALLARILTYRNVRQMIAASLFRKDVRHSRAAAPAALPLDDSSNLRRTLNNVRPRRTAAAAAASQPRNLPDPGGSRKKSCCIL